ncbi:MAG: hypothetical protein JKY80_00720 [Mariprofundaceae bacterium]|nr:hypothetical protein [Mariprofundaceae bacterium]
MKKRLSQVRHSRKVEAAYEKALMNIVRAMHADIKKQIVPFLRRREDEIVLDSMVDRSATFDDITDEITKIFTAILGKYSSTAFDKSADKIAERFAKSSDKQNKGRFARSAGGNIGVSLSNIVETDGLKNVLKSTVEANVSLIKTIPQEYFKRIERIVYDGVINKSTAKSMIDKILEASNVTRSRAKLIARDQTAKLNSALTREARSSRRECK